jgi:5-(carboxyamino)imidazole ribonucleotide mutase
METKSLKGLDSLLSIVQMPFGIPVGTVAIGDTGAKNAALYAASILGLNDKKIANNLRIWRNKQTLSVKHSPKK